MFFVAQLATDDPDDPVDIERIENEVISGLAVVAVTARQGDNVDRTCESCNNTELRLPQGDLLHNYLFMLYVESFFRRRLLTGRASANVNWIHLLVVTAINKDLPVDEAVRAYLPTGRKYFASDAAERLPQYAMA